MLLQPLTPHTPASSSRPAGEKLSSMISRWRALKAAGKVEPFVLFPQGTTCAVDAVCDFQPRVVELLRDGERVRQAPPPRRGCVGGGQGEQRRRRAAPAKAGIGRGPPPSAPPTALTARAARRPLTVSAAPLPPARSAPSRWT
jgi:hypothetical protein